MSSVLQQQLDAYGRSAERLQSAEHEAAMLCRDVEEHVAVGVALLKTLQDSVGRWQGRVRAGQQPFDLADARRYWEGYRTLNDQFRRLYDLARRIGELGYAVEGRVSLEEAMVETGLVVSVPIEKATAAEEAFGAGRGKPLAEVRDELRRRTGA